MIDVPNADITQPITPTERREPDPAELDQLIPAPMSKRRRAIVAGGLVALAIVIAGLTFSGFLLPRPTGGLSAGRSGHLDYIADTDTGLIGVIVPISNGSQRSVRIVDVDFIADGVEVHSVEALAPGDGGRMLRPEVTQPTSSLPRQLDPTSSGLWDSRDRFLVWLRPTSCNDTPGSRAIVEATFDFGDGGFPPIARTEEIVFINWDSDTTAFVEGGEPVTGDGPLAVACEVLS